MPIDVEAERALTPGCAQVAHLNNAGASLVATPTLEAVIDHLHLEAEIGGYEAAAAVAPTLAAVRTSAARLLGARPEEIAVTGSDTQSWSKAFWGFVLGGGIAPGRCVLVDRASYVSHYLAILQASEHFAFVVEVIDSGADGTIDLDSLDDRLSRGDVAMVSATHVGTHRGSINPVTQVGRAARAAGAAYFVDVCQSIGQLELDVGAIGCDVATATGRKWLRGPRGTGLLYVRTGFAGALQPIGVDGNSASWLDAGSFDLAAGAQRFEEFETSIAGQLGLGVAIDHALRLGLAEIESLVCGRAENLRLALGAIEGVTVLDGGSRRAAIVTLAKEGVPASALQEASRNASINTSVSAASWARLDMTDPSHAEVLRVSPHYVNDDEEVARLVQVVEDCRPNG